MLDHGFTKREVMRDIYENFDAIPVKRQIAIWGITQRSSEMFCETINRRIFVSYFIDITGEFKNNSGKAIFGKPVLAKEDILNSSYKKENIFILAAKEDVSKEGLQWLEKYFKKAYYICSVSGIDRIIKNSKMLYVYGAGNAGKRTYKLLKSQGITVSAFVDSDSEKWGVTIEDETIDAFVYGPDVIEKEDIIVISTRYYNDIKKLLLERGIPDKNIFVDIRNSGEFSVNPIQYKDRVGLWFTYTKKHIIKYVAWYEFFMMIMADFIDKKVILYGINEFTPQFVSLFRLLNLDVLYCIDCMYTREELEAYEITIDYKNLYEISSEDLSDKIVYAIKIKETEHGISDVDYSILEKLGLDFYKEFRVLDSAYPLRNSTVEVGLGLKRDKLLEYTWVYKKTSLEYPGYVVLGNEETARKRIIILGGSTSDVGLYEYFIKSWPEFLSEELKDVVIFCGAIAAYYSKQELLKLLRDGRQLNPDLVISYSGFNDMAQPHTEGYPYAKTDLKGKLLEDEAWGIKTDRLLSEDWIESENMMKVISNAYGAEFIGIFQPVIMNKDNKTFEEKIIYEWSKELSWINLNEYKSYQDNVRKNITGISYIYDMTKLFYGEKRCVFRDVCHLTEYGNRVLANAILRIIHKRIN